MRRILAPLCALLSLTLAACSAQVRPAGYTQESSAPSESASDASSNPSTSPQASSTSSEPALSRVDVPRTPELPPLPLPPGATTVGSPGGIALEAAGAGGRWLAYCQAGASSPDAPLDVATDARGNALGEVRVFLSSGAAPREIDAVLAADSRGAFLVVLQAEEAFLVDVAGQREISLSALSPDLRFDESPEHRSFAFSEGGELLFVLSDEGKKLVVVDLRESEPLAQPFTVPLVDRSVWRVTSSGGFAVLHELPEGSEPSRWPIAFSSEPVLRCRQGAFAAHARLSAPLVDRELARSLLRLPLDKASGGALGAHLPEPQEAPGFVMTFGNAWIRRTDEGRVLLVDGSRQRQISSSRCGGRLLHADRDSGYFLVACEEYRPVRAKKKASKKRKRSRPKYRFDLYLIRPGTVRDLEADIMRTGVDLPAARGPRFVPLRPGASAALADFRQRRLLRLEKGDRVLATSDHGALLAHDSQLLLWTPKERRVLAEGLFDYDDVLSAGPVVAVGKSLHLLTEARVESRELPAAPLYLDPEGGALIPEGPRAPGRWARGPLHWVPAPARNEASEPESSESQALGSAADEP